MQLTAADEHRRNFSLININSAVSRGRGEEYALPGVHADVGGCYRNVTKEDPEEEWETRMFNYDERDYVLEQGWYTDDQIKVIEMQRERGQPVRYIEGTRPLPNTYSYIPLTVMADKMIEKELPLKSDRLKANYPIPSELTDQKDRIFDYIFNDGPPLEFRPIEELNQELANGDISRKAHRKQLQDSIMLMKLRNDYLHFSAEFGDLVNKPNRTFWTGRRKREINNG